MDEVIFNQRNEVGAQYGQFYFQQVDTESRNYAIAMFLNASSIPAPHAYTAYVLQGIMRDQLEEPELRLNFNERPLPFGFKLQSYVNAGQGVITTMSFAVAFMMASDSLVQAIIKER